MGQEVTVFTVFTSSLSRYTLKLEIVYDFSFIYLCIYVSSDSTNKNSHTHKKKYTKNNKKKKHNLYSFLFSLNKKWHLLDLQKEKKRGRSDTFTELLCK